MAGEFDTADPRYVAVYDGVVVDRKDPLKLGRVRARVPGLIEPASAWAFPVGTVGGGSGGRGFFSVPEEGAEVSVMFHQGDPDHPRYFAGHWGLPDGVNEVPSPVADEDVTPDEAPDIRVFETPKYLLIFDDREDKENMVLRDKLTGDQIEFDGVGQGITIQATAALILKADGLVSIEGTAVQINGRPVQASSKPL